MSVYGQKIDRSEWNRRRSVITAPSASGTGNIILRVGREHDPLERGYDGRSLDGSWEQTEHVVLTPAEARRFATEILLALLEPEA